MLFVFFLRREVDILFICHWESHSYTHIYVCPNCVVNMYLCVYDYVSVCVCVCVFMCVNVGVYVCINVLT